MKFSMAKQVKSKEMKLVESEIKEQITSVYVAHTQCA